MAKGFAIHNSMTTHGGIIQATQQRTSQMGNLFLRAGDGHYCPQCQCWSKIVKSHDHIIMDGKAVAYVDDLLTCGAKILPKQHHVVGDSQGENYRSSALSNLRSLNIEQNFKNSLTSANKESLNGYYYNIDTGLYEGSISNGIGDKESVYACKGKKSEHEYTSPQKANITHKKFQECARVIEHESGTASLECIYIAFAANNYAKKINTNLHSLLMSGYSTMPSGTKTPLPDKPQNGKIENPKYGFARRGILKVFLNENDPTDGATHWDGTDFLVWGLVSPYKDRKTKVNLAQAKFREYKKITIPKVIYEQYLNGTLREYPKGKVRYNGIFYNIPADVFLDKNNWKSGDFIYETGSRVRESLVAKVATGHTIFWKAS